MAHPATKKRGGDPDVKHKPAHEKPDDAAERKLEQGLEESMAGSDPVSITQPSQEQDRQAARGQKSTPTEACCRGSAAKAGLAPAFCVVAQPLVTI